MRLKSNPEVLALGAFTEDAEPGWDKLKDRGYLVNHIVDLTEGLKSARSHRVDLVVLDARSHSVEELVSYLEELRVDPSHRNAFTPLVVMVDRLPEPEVLEKWRSRISAMVDSEISAVKIVMKILVHCRAQPFRKAA